MNTNPALALHTCLRPHIAQWLAFTLFLAGSGTAVTQEVGPEGEFNATYAVYQSLVAEEKYAEAIPHARRALELGQMLYGDADSNTAALTLNLGTCLRKAGEASQAVPVLKDAVELFGDTAGGGNMKMIDPLIELGHALVQAGSRGPYLHYYERALRIARNHASAHSALYGELSLEIGEQIVFVGRDGYGRRFLAQANDALERSVGPDDLRTGRALFNLGKFELAMDDAAAAEPLLTGALRVFAAAGEPGDSLKLLAHAFLVSTYDDLGNTVLAEEHILAISRLSPAVTGDALVPLIRREPEFPLAARRAGATGYVDVEFTVNESGRVQAAHVLDWHGHRDFPAAALAAIAEFRYAPRNVDGRLVATDGVRHRITFSAAPHSRQTSCNRSRELYLAMEKAATLAYRGATIPFNELVECP